MRDEIIIIVNMAIILHFDLLILIIIKIIVIMVSKHIPTMTKSHHGGNMSVTNMVRFCHGIFPPLKMIMMIGEV